MWEKLVGLSEWTVRGEKKKKMFIDGLGWQGKQWKWTMRLSNGWREVHPFGISTWEECWMRDWLAECIRVLKRGDMGRGRQLVSWEIIREQHLWGGGGREKFWRGQRNLWWRGKIGQARSWKWWISQFLVVVSIPQSSPSSVSLWVSVEDPEI